MQNKYIFIQEPHWSNLHHKILIEIWSNEKVWCQQEINETLTKINFDINGGLLLKMTLIATY